MSTLSVLLRTWFQQSPRTGHTHDEAYLAQAVDLRDLERRMRDLDRGQLESAGLTLPGICGR